MDNDLGFSVFNDNLIKNKILVMIMILIEGWILPFYMKILGDFSWPATVLKVRVYLDVISSGIGWLVFMQISKFW